MIKLQGISFTVSYNCNLRCAHCFHQVDGPARFLGTETLSRVFQSLGKAGTELQWVHFTGGEATLKMDLLEDLLTETRRHTRASIGIASNGWWATSPEQASRVLARLTERGMGGMIISADRYHQDWLALSRVVNAATALASQGLGAHSWVVSCDQEPGKGEYDIGARVSAASSVPLARTLVRLLGKAIGGSGEADSSTGIGKDLEGPCTELSTCLGESGPLEPAMVWIDPYGNVSICYGIIIGNVNQDDLGTLLSTWTAENRPVSARLAQQGPAGLYRLCQERGLPLPRGPFMDKCQLCAKSRAVLRASFPEELGPTEQYPQG